MLGCLMVCSNRRNIAGFAGRARWMVALGSVAVAATSSFAEVQPPNAGMLLQSVPVTKHQESQLDLIEQKLQGIKAMTDVEGLKLEVKSIRISGLTVISPDELQPAVSKFIGPDKNFQDLLDAAGAIRRELAQRGYFLADAIIPQQKIENGIVEIFVIEGRLGKVRVEYDDNVMINHTLINEYVSELETGSVITARAVERALFLISDLRGIHARSVFEPGEKVGTADLVIKVSQAKSFDGNVDFDMNGSEYTGYLRGGGGVDGNNLLGQGDLLSVRSSKSLDTGGMGYMRTSYLTPFGPWGSKIGASYSVLHYRLGTVYFDPAKASGKAAVSSIVGVHPFIRSRNVNFMVMYQFDDRRLHDIQETPGLLTDKALRVNSVILSGDLRDPLFGGGINVGNLAFTSGRVNFFNAGARAIDSDPSAGRHTQGDYSKANLTYSRLQQLTKTTGIYVSFSEQWASKNLDMSEKFSLGGPNAVRAYPQGEASGDEGYVGAIEMRYGVSKTNWIMNNWMTDWMQGSMAFTAFYDYGRSRLNKIPNVYDVANVANISGVGAGLNWEDPNNWTMRTTAAWRLNQKPQSETIDRKPRVYFQLSKYF